jgi:hypothetical protein
MKKSGNKKGMTLIRYDYAGYAMLKKDINLSLLVDACMFWLFFPWASSRHCK